MYFGNEIKIDQGLLSRFNLLKPRDGHDKVIPLQKYVNDLLADNITAAEELSRDSETSRVQERECEIPWEDEIASVRSNGYDDKH